MQIGSFGQIPGSRTDEGVMQDSMLPDHDCGNGSRLCSTPRLTFGVDQYNHRVYGES
jgi:hypothetical protein